MTGELPAHRASNAENVSIWWRHYERQIHGQSRPVLMASALESDVLMTEPAFVATDRKPMMTSSNGNIFRVTCHWPVNSPHKCQWRGALMFSFICVWINGWIYNREAGILRRHRAHYDVSPYRKDVTERYTANWSYFEWTNLMLTVSDYDNFPLKYLQCVVTDTPPPPPMIVRYQVISSYLFLWLQIG